MNVYVHYEDEDMEYDYVNSKYDVEETHKPMLKKWDDGLLAIGTLAIGPLDTGNFEMIKEIKNTNYFNYHNLNYYDFENTEETPLMNVATLFSHELDEEIVGKTNTTPEQAVNYVVELDDNNDDINNKDEGQAMKRVSLADLLLEDSNEKLVKQLADNKQLHQANVLSDDVIAMSKPSVYDITPFLDDHPGGDDVLLTSTGKDATDDFEDVGHSENARNMLKDYYVGDIDTSTIPLKQNVRKVQTSQATIQAEQGPSFLVKLLQFLLPFVIVGVAFALKKFKETKE
ncbi:hypothetical protein KSS87_023432 [Heliosperma pusillum]|nr:hypothetical protein KSS87_023432 [Heliosperma pusillum]